MPRTINEGFLDFHSKLTPSETETASAASHRESIEARLKRDFKLLRFFRIGSFGNGTSISGYSDVDYLASLSENYHGDDSTYSLSKVRASLADRFSLTDVRVNCPAVSIPFGTRRSETHEIVPGSLTSTEGFHAYKIPNCAGGWMKVSPEAHIAYVNAVNKKLGYKVKPLIRFIKAWKFFQAVPISSFYLELRAASYANGETSILYDIDVTAVLRKLWRCQLAAIQDPMGVSGLIPACKSETLRQNALSKLETALTRAEKAREEAVKENIYTAFEWWRKLYNNEFPTYYR